MRRHLVPLLLLALALALAGCGQDGATSEETKPTPQRIVSLSPTATEMLFAIGAGGQVVAVDSNSNYPKEAPRTELSAYEPNIEAIAGYKPDLVVYSDDPGELAAGLSKLGIPALQQPAATKLDDTYAQLDELGKATGHEAEAGRLVTTMRAEIEKIAGADRPERPLTYYHELDKNLYSATSETFIGQLYDQLGKATGHVAEAGRVTATMRAEIEQIRRQGFAIAPNQSVLAFSNWVSAFTGSRWANAARNWSALSMVGVRVMVEAEAEPVYSSFIGWPACPRLVVIRTTPLAALVP